MFDAVANPAYIDPALDCRAVTFENPTGARASDGAAHGGRKGAPNGRPVAYHSALTAAKRVDDYCATAYVYCRDPQPVPRLDVAAALADIERRASKPPAGDGAPRRHGESLARPAVGIRV